MATGAFPQGVDQVRAAMDRVLDAEREAQAEIERAHETARALLREARDGVRRIEERARARQARIHAACDVRAAASIESLRREAGLAAPDSTDAREAALVAAACRRLAAILTEPS